MAIKQVRVQVGGVWYPLTYDSVERCYWVSFPAGDTSADQPGGYFNAVVEASNDGGKTVSIDGHALPSLRLVVKDLTAPELVLASPPEGYLTTHTPQIVVEITDNASGVDPATVTATAEGGTLPVETAEIPGGYRATVSPTWEDGPHRVEFSATDRDGNTGRLTLHYTVDTMPPVLRVWDHRLVVDTETVLIRGTAQDSAGAAVMVSTGDWSTDTTTAADGAWRAAVPLAVGVNEITVKARGGAGLTTAWTGTVIRLITDRTSGDLAQAKDLLRRIPAGEATPEELERYNRGELRGCYDFTDLNRVNSAVELVHDSLKAQGYLLDVQTVSDSLREPAHLPSGYSLLEYIHSNGAQYISTDFHPTQNTKVKARFKSPTNGRWLCGAVESNGQNGYGVFTNGTVFGTGSWNTNINLYDGLWHDIVYENGNLRSDGSLIQSTVSRPFQTIRQLYIFAVNLGGTVQGNVGEISLSCLKVSEGDRLVYDFVPCKNSSGAVGLFDLVNGQFYENSGTGAFIAGPVVARAVDLAEVTELEYIESSGTQYVDTGVPVRSTSGFKVDFAALSTQGTIGLIGGFNYGGYNHNFSLISGQWSTMYGSNESLQFGSTDKERHRVSQNVTAGATFFDGVPIKTGLTFYDNVQRTFRMFCLNGGSTYPTFWIGAFKLYSCKIYDDGTLVRDYMAAKLTDGTVGLYDKLSGLLYINAGTGSFSAGPEISQGAPVVSDFDEADAPAEFILQRHLKNVSSILGARPVNTSVTLPLTMDNLSIRDANSLEQALVAADEVTPIIRKSFIYAGEAMAGEF